MASRSGVAKKLDRDFGPWLKSLTFSELELGGQPASSLIGGRDPVLLGYQSCSVLRKAAQRFAKGPKRGIIELDVSRGVHGAWMSGLFGDRFASQEELLLKSGITIRILAVSTDIDGYETVKAKVV